MHGLPVNEALLLGSIEDDGPGANRDRRSQGSLDVSRALTRSTGGFPLPFSEGRSFRGASATQFRGGHSIDEEMTLRQRRAGARVYELAAASVSH